MELKDTIEMMVSDDYKERLKAEYWQTKIRHDKLRSMINKLEAIRYQPYSDKPEDFLGFEPKVSMSLLQDQFRAMEDYLHALEVHAIVEHIDLD